MASNYTASYTNVQAPATAPAVNNSPVLSLIQDADGNTAANLYQAWKVLADNEDLLLKILGATLTAKGLQIDGTGGAASALAAGMMQSKGIGVSTSSTVFNPGVGHYGSAGTIPTVTPSTGAGTGPTVTVTAGSTDVRGSISVTTGTSPAASATVCTLFYANAYASSLGIGGVVLIGPATATAAALSGNGQVYVAGQATDRFAIQVGSSALAASTAYGWNYWVIG